MVSLLTEYRERHGVKFVPPLDEGLCFFDINKQPGAIVLTSSHSRSNINCRGCLAPQGGLVGEMFVTTGLAWPHVTWKIERHEHIHPDTDLREWVNTQGKEGVYEPYIASSFRDVECWIWQFFIRHNPLFVRKWVSKEEPFRSQEQIAWVLGKNKVNYKPKLFEEFYRGLYYRFILGRKYLLYG